ncbi:hypothetical protein KC845_01230 [Candidatus Kaiserbacteria bacterium]|nr:hypothetical protein [Candidatus Kaiserbacteria bacterium]
MGFKKSSLPKKIPNDLQSTINELNLNSKNKKEFLDNAYKYVTSQYYGSRIKTVFYFWRAFGNPLYKSPGFLQCNGQNYILRTILEKSLFFKGEDIRIIHRPFNFFIHQYLRVRVDDTYINVDPWSNFKGLKLGQNSAWFG